MNPRMQVFELAPEVRFVGLPRQSVHAGRSLLLQIEERLFEQIDGDVVQERGEPLLLPFLCRLTYAVQTVGRACPARCPERAALFRVSLGPRPWLRRLRSGSLRLVRRLRSYYGGVGPLAPVHPRSPLLPLPNPARPGPRPPAPQRPPPVP